MSEAPDELNSLLRWLAAESPDEAGAHITPERLTAYHSGKLPAMEESRVQDHLVLCRGCTQLLLDLAAFPALDEQGARQLSDAEVTTRWKAMPKEIRKEGKAASARPFKWPRLNLSFSWPGFSYAMAAVLFIAAAGLLVWVLSLRQQNRQLALRLDEQAARDQHAASAADALKHTRQQLEEARQAAAQAETQIAQLRQSVDELSSPQLNVPITDLYPQAFDRSQPAAVKRIEVPAGANLFTLILNTADQQAYASYALEVSNLRGRLIWRGQGLQKSQFNNFTLTLPRRLFPAGQYRIKLYGVRDGSKKLVEEYWLRIQYK
jgi:anti-sigma factor RsiW